MISKLLFLNIISISLCIYTKKGNIFLPFEIKKFNEKQLLTTELCFIDKNSECYSFVISLSSYAPWICVNSSMDYIYQLWNKSTTFAGSYDYLRGVFEPSKLIVDNKAIIINFFRVSNYSNTCFKYQHQTYLQGELGLNIVDVKNRELKNISFIEQLFKGKKNLHLQAIIKYDNTTNNRGVVVFGNNILTIPPLITLKYRDYIREINDNFNRIGFFFPNSNVIEELQRNYTLLFSFENKKIIFPRILFDIMVKFLKEIKNNDKESETFGNLCKSGLVRAEFSTIYLCEQSIMNFTLPTIQLFSSTGEIIKFDSNYLMDDYLYKKRMKKIFIITKSEITSCVVLGESYFKYYTTVIDFADRRIKIYSYDALDVPSYINYNLGKWKNIQLIILKYLSIFLSISCIFFYILNKQYNILLSLY